jgi:hypothetical protein
LTLKPFALFKGRAAAACLAFAALAPWSSAFTAPAPEQIVTDAKSNGIAVRPADGALFITDDRSNSILMREGSGSFTPYATLPSVEGQPNSLSQLAFADSGELLIQRFGFGSSGAIFDIARSGASVQLTGTDPVRRRLGLAVLGQGRLLSTWFIKDKDRPISGGLSLVTYDATNHSATERDLLTGLNKPVGVAVVGDNVFVADQVGNAIFRASLAELLGLGAPRTASAKAAEVKDPDMMAADIDGTLYTKCNSTELCAIAPDGRVSVMARDFHDTRGVAIDTQRRLLYVVDRTAATAGATTTIRVIPIK